jgi:hypothetical protein
MHPIANKQPGSRMTTGVVGRKEPRPHPVELELGVLPGQASRQHQWNSVLFVSLPRRTGNIELLHDLGNQRRGQSHHPIFATFGSPDAEPELLKIHILDPEIERFGDTQPTTA